MSNQETKKEEINPNKKKPREVELPKRAPEKPIREPREFPRERPEQAPIEKPIPTKPKE
jgi:hypothetical protein